MSKDDFGIPALFKQLDGLEKKLRNKVLKSALRDAAKVVAAEVRATSPVLSGRQKRSVKVRAGKSRKKGQMSVEVVISGGHDEGFVGFGEFGKVGQPADPRIRRAAEAKTGEALDTIEAKLRGAIREL